MPVGNWLTNTNWLGVTIGAVTVSIAVVVVETPALLVKTASY